MDIEIAKADLSRLGDCASILEGSELGRRYFCDARGRYIGGELLREGFEKEEVSVALGGDGACLGFAWIQPRGIFHWFPFLHVVAVRADLRGRGIGGKLMDLFERAAFVEERSPMAFLMVADFNAEAIALYGKRGYERVGAVPGLFLPGVDEILMMKLAPARAGAGGPA
ncbi:MAG TPA: GNAT family N-acetyltransferase [Spirochaetia bacterium]|nr:GNAT family N-acetyltransferase [Spirochaetia bacterium]